MSEVLGDAEPYDDRADPPEADDDDEGYAEGGFTRRIGVLANPGALSLTSLILAVLSMLGLFSAYALTEAIVATRVNRGPLYGLRVNAAAEIGLAVLAGICAGFAFRATARLDDPDLRRGPLTLAGAALLVAALSVAIGIAALALLAGADPGSTLGS